MDGWVFRSMRMIRILLSFAIILLHCGSFAFQITSYKAARTLTRLKASLIVGLNKYSHDTACCIVDSSNGQVLFAQAKERLTGRKHDGGGVGELVRTALESIGGRADDVKLVVSNNHHFRVRPFERRLPFAASINSVPPSYLDEYNLLPKARHMELSHHLAHAWSGLSSAPFKQGLVLVMDGMGESYKAMMEDVLGVEEDSGDYMHDLKLPADSLITQPATFSPGSGYREAESAYIFDSEEAVLKPVFKRWSRERSPPELYNTGFENMESLGAVYSRVSSHIMGDWNACGKVMGLASWADCSRSDAKDWRDNTAKLTLASNAKHSFLTGNSLDGSVQVNWKELEQLQQANDFSDSSFGYHAGVAHSMQRDLESTTMQMLRGFRASSQQRNLVLVGGVALNSVLNGLIAESKLFDNVYIPPCPGDEGIAVGCAMYGLQRCREELKNDVTVAFHQEALSPYQGLLLTDAAIEEALEDYEPFLSSTWFHSSDQMINDAADAIANGEVIAWFQGRSELGQRALGHRSILADPRVKGLRAKINSEVKHREWFRPLAPSVLDEYVSDWFEGIESGENASPFMSLTARIKESKLSAVPAVAHVDGTARLQTVTCADNKLYHQLITAFFKRTGVPMVLNTSLNGKKQPIVESPAEAIKAMLATAGSVKTLYIGRCKVQLKGFPLADASSPAADEEELLIGGQTVYLCEVTSSLGDGMGKGVKVRIQDADAVMTEGWRDLPSELHLDVLQLLQAGELAVGELWASLQGLQAAQTSEQCDQDHGAGCDCGSEQLTEGAVSLTWSDARAALHWLYHHALVHFPEGDEG